MVQIRLQQMTGKFLDKCKILPLLLFILMLQTNAFGQVTTNSGSGLSATYASLDAAITALNAATITSPVVITLGANQTAPNGGYIITAQGTNVNTITIDGGNYVVTAFTPQTTGTYHDAIFELRGADWVTIQNFSMQENSSNTNITGSTNTMTEWGVALTYATVTNGANNNTIQNNTISLNRTYANTWGIYANATHSSSSTTTTATATGSAGGNSGLKIYGNSISNVNMGICVVGPTAAADFNTSVDIGGASLSTGNTISNFGTTGTFVSSPVNVSGTVNGILVRNTNAFNIRYNSIASSSTSQTAATLRGIFIPSFSVAPTGTNTQTISDNSISLQSGSTSGTVVGIAVESTTGNATTSLSIANNNFTRLNHFVASPTGTMTGISCVMPNLSNTISGNTFSNLTVTSTGTFTFFAHSYTMASGMSFTLSNNSISGTFSRSGAGSVTISTTNGSSASGSLASYSDNNFSNISGATTITGINNTDGTTGTSTKTITGNTFSNWSCSSTILGMTITYMAGTTNTISNNTFNNLTTSGTSAVTGINIGSTLSAATTINVTGNQINNLNSAPSGTGSTVIGIGCSNVSTTINFSGNTIHTLNTTGGSSVTGINVTGAATNNIFGNKIYNLSGGAAGSTVNGINISSGTTFNIYNNLIGDLKAPAATGLNSINGLNLAASSTYNLFFNNVVLNASSSGATFGTSCITFSSTATSLTLRNNILVNVSTAGTESSNLASNGIIAVLRRSAGTAATIPANYNVASNKNLFWVNSAAGTNNHLVYVEGTSTITNPMNTLSNFKSFVGNRDQSSFEEQLGSTTTNLSLLVSLSGSNSQFLRIADATATQAESGADVITTPSITVDYTGVAGNRSTTPDVGAYEFAGNPVDLTGPSISYSPLSFTCSTGNRTLSATISDPSGVPTSGSGLPVLYFSVNSGPYSSATGSYISGNTFEFSFGSGVSSGDVVSYYIVAQDNMGNLNSFPTGATGLVANPPSAATPPGSPSTYSIANNLSGTYTVGSAGNYATLTAAVASYNTSCLSGPVVFSLTDATYSSAETFPITISANSFASLTNTLTIVPASGINATISGTSTSALVVLNGSDYVIINGSNNNTTSRNLSITNTNTSATTAAVLISSLGNAAGATNNEIRNVNFTSSSTSNLTYAISIGGSSVAVGGADNDNNTVSGNSFSNFGVGVYAAGVSGGVMDNLTISTNTHSLSGSTASPVFCRVIFADNSLVSQNSISIITSNGSSPVGISIENNVSNSRVNSNLISQCATTSTGGWGARGIVVGTGITGSNITLANNVIYNVNGSNYTAFGNSSSMGIGIGVSGTSSTISTTTGGVNLYNNSVNLYGSHDYSGSTITAALYVGSGSSGLDIRNNNFVNTLNNTNSSGTGAKQYAIYSAAANTAFTTINNNNYFVSGAQGVLAFLSSDQNTLSALQTALGQNTASLSVNPVFNSNTLLRPAIGSPVLGAGTPIVSVTVDYLGLSRGNPPSIGAYETGGDGTAPTISFTTIPNTQSTSNQTVSATITDSGIGATGVDISVANRPAIYFRKHSDANAFGVANNSTGNGWKYKQTTSTTSPFSLEIDGSLLQSAPTAGDTIFYFVVAQDSAGNIAAETSAGFAATSVTSVTAAPTTLSRYIIVGPPLAGTYTVGTGGNFTTITEAVNNLNLRGVSAAVVFELTDALYSTGETFPIVLSNYTGISASNTVTILPAAANSAAEISGTNATAIFSFDNGDYYTLDGRPGGTGSTSALTISNANTSAPTIRFINDASNNVVKFAAIKGASTSSTSGVVVFGTTTQTDGNDANTISNNSISNSTGGNPYNLIYSAGTAAKTNSGNTISDNNLSDFFNASGANAIAISSNSTGFSITGNSIYQSATRTVGGTFRGISIDNTSGSNFTVSNNYIGGSAPLAAGTAMTFASAATVFQGIYINADTSVASSVQGNTIQNINITTTSTSTVQGLIYLNAGRFNVGTITANTLGSTSATGSILISTTGSTGTFAAIGLGTSNFAEVNISNNQIGGIEFSGTGNMSLRGIDLAGSTGRFNVSNNLIGSTTIANSLSQGTNNSLIGIINRNSSATQPIVISNNTIANGTITLATGAATIRGITSGTPNLQITNNTIYNLSSNNATTSTGQSSAVIGIIHSATGTNGQTCSGNTIHSLSSTAAAAVSVIGIHANTATSGTNVFHKNNIHSLSATNASSRVIGIEMAGGNANYYNNFIRLGIDASGSAVTSSVRFFGFNETSGTNNVYFNTVYIGGSGVGSGNDSTLAFTSSVTGVTREIRNNYFYNERTNGSGTGIHYAIQVGGTSINPTGLTLNNNNYYVSGSSLGRYNSLSVADLTAWKAAVGQDGGSISENVPFVNATGTASTVDLHIVAATQTGMESGGANISGISVDFDGDDRPGPASSTNGGASSSDIGADEFDGTPAYTCSNPVAGTAVASVSQGCFSLGSATLSLTGAVLDGTGNTYQWESSTNGSTYTPVAGANSATLVATSITQTTYYRCIITCANGPISSTSASGTIIINNPSVSSANAGTRCGTGTVPLTASLGGNATILNWFTSASGGTAFATGNAVTSPSITSTTNFYVEASTTPSTFNGLGNTTQPTSTGATAERGIVITLNSDAVINSAQYYSPTLNTTNLISVRVVNNATGVQVGSAIPLSVTQGATAAWYTMPLNISLPAGTYRLLATFGSSVNRHSTGVDYSQATFNNLGSAGSILSGWDGSATATSYNYFHNLSITSACISNRTMVTATVTAPPALTTSVSSTSICEGSSTSSPITISSNVADFDSYSWTPSSGVSGNSSIGFTFNPSSTTTYTLSASSSSSGCSNTSTLSVLVNQRPSVIVVSPSSQQVCQGASQLLAVQSGGRITVLDTIGTGTSANTLTTYPSIFSNYYGGVKHQLLFRASELVAAGVPVNTPIQSISFNVSSVGATFSGTLSDFSVDMGHTAQTVLSSSAFLGSLTSVRTASSLTVASSGWVTIPLNGAFSWNGTDNLVLQTSYSNQNSGATDDGVIMFSTDPGFVSTNWYRADGATAATILGAATPTSSGNLRPNIIFNLSQNTSFAWSPTTDLYRDPNGWVPYVNGDTVAVYARPTSGITYSVTSTSLAGCSRTGSSTITIGVPPSAPSAPVLNSATTSTLVIDWTTVSGATDYRLDVATDAGFTSFVSGYNNKTIAGTTETVGGLSVGTTYYVRLRASNSCGTSSNSTTLTTITLSSAPILTNATAISASGMTINWNASTGAASYKLDLATDNAFTSFVSGYQDLTVSGTSQAVTGLTAATRYYYRVRAVNASGTSGNSLTGDTITLSGTVGLSLTAFLEGLYIGSGTMTSAPNNAEAADPSLTGLTSSSVADTIVVELHHATTFDSLFAWRGPISTLGVASASFPGAVNGNSYYIVVKHRSSLETWSANPVSFGSSASYNFTTSASQAYGDNMISLGNGKYGIFAGDLNHDGFIDGSDFTDVDNDNANFALGYLFTDVNGDGYVDGNDFTSIDNNGSNFIGLARP